jgi:CRISPR-associated protein Cas2
MSADSTRRYLIAYDISDDARRTRVAKKLESYGDRVQYSVFVVDARPARLIRLRRDLELLADSSVDSILLCDLGTVTQAAERNFQYVGLTRPITTGGPLIL